VRVDTGCGLAAAEFLDFDGGVLTVEIQEVKKRDEHTY